MLILSKPLKKIIKINALKDNIKAYMRFNLAANKGNNNAEKWRKSLSKKMTAEQIKQSKNLARECEERNYKECN